MSQLSRKHYKQIASILADLNSDLHNAEERGDLYIEARTSFDTTVLRICSFLKSDNPNFNATKFGEAVYGKDA